MFEDKCYAWLYGPVYPNVYYMFKDFKYNPIDDERFALFENNYKKFNENEISIIDRVLNTFGRYSGKMLEKLTHNDKPWIFARKDYSEVSLHNVLIPIEFIKTYYSEKNKEFDLSSEEGIKEYINKVLDAI